jgi:hypothetical protein
MHYGRLTVTSGERPTVDYCCKLSACLSTSAPDVSAKAIMPVLMPRKGFYRIILVREEVATPGGEGDGARSRVD